MLIVSSGWKRRVFPNRCRITKTLPIRSSTRCTQYRRAFKGTEDGISLIRRVLFLVEGEPMKS
ncbi:hypothetical protein K439DRAFT_1085488 [Ramaria rubella]|nr:hypothetical protein K439DRAFT_1085488 [Ramaria rubella]